MFQSWLTIKFVLGAVRATSVKLFAVLGERDLRLKFEKITHKITIKQGGF